MSQLDIPNRAAIITLYLTGSGWTQISTMLAVSPTGAQTLFKRVCARAGVPPHRDPHQLSLLLKHLDDSLRSGRPEQFPEGSAVANALRETALRDEAHQDQPHKRTIEEVEEAEGVRIPYSTGYKVLKTEEVVKRSAPRKICLDAENKEFRH
ncbi:hypothetical protein BCR34DRAFT_603027 [Clohesyomyces aquaticus]|uniref:Uncharacterized protein n=1 Tax=Clohesyomyces aquaticus TaxID=1231657 RepID=A0A1Y1ZG68_9PLEO|nr:hypothetical protein BCR34DRAFT_603027 [Clohesyomyces aquaticus]